MNSLSFGLAAVGQFLIGGFWYNFPLTVQPWVNGMRQYLASPKWPNNVQTNFVKVFGWEIVLILIRTYVTQHFLHFLNIKTMTDAVKVCSVHFPLF
jgi:hypothetical protein